MKKSKYNYFIKDGGKTICFNGVSGRIFSVSEKEFVLLDEALNNPDLPEKNNPQLISWLKKNNFLVDTDINEAEHFLQENRKDVYSSTYQLILNPTLECNFNCWYCYERHPKGHMSQETVNRIKQYIHRLTDDKKIEGIDLSWFGGEPLLYFNEIIYPLAGYIKRETDIHGLHFRHSITTNGYFADRDMIDKFDGIDLRFFQITLDGDRETHNKIRNHNGEPSFDTIVQNIIHLCQYLPDSTVLLRINYTNEILSKDYRLILDIIPEVVRNQIRINFQRVWQTANTASKNNQYLLKNISDLREMGFRVSPDNIYRANRTHVCYADRFNYAHINYDGKVYKCTAQDYSDEHAIGELDSNGNIQWKKDVLEKMYARANFEGKKCMQCKHLPICGGPCLKQALNYKEGADICPSVYKEMKVSTYIRESYKNFSNKISINK
jgi:uncharacterized protein